MGPEQLPENKGGRAPPASGVDWLLKEGEITPEESRILGHLLYAGIFTGVSQPVYFALQQEYEQEQERERDERAQNQQKHDQEHGSTDNSKPLDLSTISAQRYIEKYAQIYGLVGADLLKRWAHQASIELANATIPVLLQERDRLAREEWWSLVQVKEYTQDIIEPVVEVAQQGISSSVEYHQHLVGEAYYMDRDLGDVVPFNSSLIRGIFDNRSSHI